MSVIVCTTIFLFTFFALICMVVFGGTWFGIFFGINYPQIVVKNSYRKVNCHVSNHTIVNYTCCQTNCWCNECDSDLFCSQVPQNFRIPGFSTSCCGGPSCCRHCTSCTDSGEKRTCRRYCCSSVFSRQCTINCHQCYKAQATVQFISQTKIQQLVETTITKDCKRDYSCIENYFHQHPITPRTNSTTQQNSVEQQDLVLGETCYHNPKIPTEAKFDVDFTRKGIGLLISFTILFALAILMVCLAIVGWCGFACWQLIRIWGADIHYELKHVWSETKKCFSCLAKQRNSENEKQKTESVQSIEQWPS